jgi:hypothetical protein
MSARHYHIDNMIPQLDEMREAVAAAAHDESNERSHKAYMRQAQSLRAIYGQVTSTWFNVEQELKSKTGSADEETTELLYAERLGDWLRAHAKYTLDTMEGGEIDIVNQCSNFREEELAILRLYAQRHHAMVADYCEKHATALEERAEELRNAVPRP